MFDFVTEKHVYIKQNCYFSPGYRNAVTKPINKNTGSRALISVTSQKGNIV